MFIVYKVAVVYVFRQMHSLRFGDIRGGELVVGESTVGEFSLSSLKLKLFLFSDSAPV